MNIVYNCNDKFAVHTAVSITSLFEHNKSADEINVYILGNGVRNLSISRFDETAARYGRAIQVIDLKDYETVLKLMLGKAPDTGSFDVTVLARLFAPSHLPDEVSRFLYLDADTVVLGDISELYDTELSGNVCAMAAEPTIYADTRERLGLGAADPYFNSGMLLVDRIAWERERITAECMDFYKSVNAGALSFPDQDIMNFVLKGRIKHVWQGYNFFSNYAYQSYGNLCAEAPWYSALMSKDDFEGAKAGPKVVHFAGAERPWIKGNFNPYKNEYEKYLAMTPWAGEPKLEGQETKMLMYHCMNLVTKLCPPARRVISAFYYNMKIRGRS
ncbi:MAG: glycosyltransferase family 8 protein [Eubacteriales bacterium]|nr:glycosyltransferase family 8 protein [Eubacteriales bacterium]